MSRNLDFQKQEAKQCLWDQDGDHTGKRWRNRGKGRGKDRRLIQELLDEAGSASKLEHEIAMSQEADEASYCHFHGPCERCKAREEQTR